MDAFLFDCFEGCDILFDCFEGYDYEIDCKEISLMSWLIPIRHDIET